MSRYVLSLVALLTCLATGLGCSGITSPMSYLSAKDVRSELYRFSGERQGSVWLKRHYQSIVGSAMDPSEAKSFIGFHGLRTRFSGYSPKGETVYFESPAGAKHRMTQARVVSKEAIRPLRVAPPVKTKRKGIDPDRLVWRADFPTLQKGEVLEFMMEFDIKGTLIKDTRALAATDGYTAQMLLSYYVDKDDSGAFQVVGKDIRGLVTQKDSYDVIALVVNDIKQSDSPLPYARYVTRKTNPRGYMTKFATSWTATSSAYKREFGEQSVRLRGRNVVPFAVKELSRESIETLYIWTRDRIQRPDALETSWNSGRPLAQVLANNDLNAVDKVHLLHWLLESSGLSHDVAIARSNRYPRIDHEFPSPGLFDTPLIYVSSYQLWLDPGCTDCGPGQVRPALKGRTALVLSGSQEGTILELPSQ
jgi:hypothetical protein